MAITAFSGPVVTFGAGGESNPQAGPSLFYAGSGIIDPRSVWGYLPGEMTLSPTIGWHGTSNITTLCAVPYQKATSAIVASANPTSATLTLVSANSATTGVYITKDFVRGDTGAADTNGGAGLVALESYTSTTASCAGGVLTITANSAMPISPGMVINSVSTTVSGGTALGTVVLSQLTAGTAGMGVAGTYQLSAPLTFNSGTVTFCTRSPIDCSVPFQAPSFTGLRLWNPNLMVGRAVAVTAASGATYATATISGYDVYGFPMSEAITISAASQVIGKKAFKYIKSVVLSGGTADTTHAYSVDTADIFGLPLRSDTYGDVLVNYAAALNLVTGIPAATSYLPSDRTTATTTTGDVRGTIGAFTAATGTSKLIVRQSPQPTNVMSSVGLFGVAQA